MVEVVLVARVGDEVACVQFIRHSDGSASGMTSGAYGKLKGWPGSISRVHEGAEGSSEAWKGLWDRFVQDGFILLQDAQSQGLLPADWAPPPPFPWFPRYPETRR